MIFKSEKETLLAYIKGDLNYQKSLELYKAAKDKKDVKVIFECTKFIDSEGIKTLFSLKKQGKNLTLINVPEIFSETVKILSLNELLECIKG